MVLMAREGAAFELAILDYEFPAIEDDRFDSNWLLVRLSVVTLAKRWNATGSCVLTCELVQLADWLDAVAANKPVEREQEFMEPNLRFELERREPEAAVIDVEFDLEFHPDRLGYAGDPYRHRFEVTPQSLREGARQLRIELAHFPFRGPVN